ncbi:MAG TPA: transketolase [Syntrophales bacterium]|jgi:transketolase|nr:transketolase [Syntrophales bacterium]HOU78845.1 transketolase [Syntrophales bacterium]HPC33346.1 transketolase [Syntrophales bacterium]HQG35116.1 transketolase [Syntrophales bacterium]HQI36283.1 transketolase [Syntrophales bacterium]
MIEERCINTIRFLAADAAEKAKSGHPGMPMGAAALAYTLWMRHLKHNPADPAWPDRDRVVLSAGHASMLLYSLLYLTGYDLTVEDIQEFRQWGSKTPGHPELGRPPGTEMTTGPLGQGISHAVGMALAEAHLAAVFNRPGHKIVDHCTYVLASDGDIMEGVTAESCALAGHLGLGKLIVMYDENGVSLAGDTVLALTEDVGGRFAAAGWQVLNVADGNDIAAIDTALATAKEETGRPTLIRVRTCIGYGAPTKEGTSACHGAPLGTEELTAAKERLGWPREPAFHVPVDVLEHCRRPSLEKGAKRQQDWVEAFRRYEEAFPEAAGEWKRIMTGVLPEGWETSLPDFSAAAAGGAAISTRKVSEQIMQSLAARIPELMGGSADLNPSCLTWLKGRGDFQKPLDNDTPKNGQKPANADVPAGGAVGGGWDYRGRNIHFGVREHAMGAIAGGMALHGGIIPYTATFFTFTDYMRPPMRLAALMGLRVIYIFTHDSIAVGEDGPTHQPVEQLMNLRAVPNLTVIRPADAAETAQAWQVALTRREGPTALVFTRQNVPQLDRREVAPATGLRKGGYILWDSSLVKPDIIFIATGSEIHLALAAARRLAAEAIRVRVVSMPSWDIFDAQPPEYRERVLPPSVKARIAVEAGVKLGWEHYVGLDGAVIGMDRFGASAPAHVLYEKFGFTAENIADTARMFLKKQ